MIVILSLAPLVDIVQLLGASHSLLTSNTRHHLQGNLTCLVNDYSITSGLYTAKTLP